MSTVLELYWVQYLDKFCIVIFITDFQMMIIPATILGLFMLHISAAQFCSTPFQAVFVTITKIGSMPESPSDPNYTFYRETLRFTDAEVEQEEENAIQHFNTQFGLDFSSSEPNELGQRFVGNATFGFSTEAINLTAVGNNWLMSGRRRSRCFNIGVAGFEVFFASSMMLHGVYGGEEGRPVFGGEVVSYGYYILYDACGNQPILIQARSEVPGRALPVEGWAIQELVLYNRWLGTGRLTGIYKGPEDNREIISFP